MEPKIQACDKCGTVLKWVFPEGYGRRIDDYPQLEQALVITLGGGYGMLLDFIDMPPPKFVLCQQCGVEFLQDNFWLITPDMGIDAETLNKFPLLRELWEEKE